MTFLDAIVVQLREDVLEKYPWFLQDYYFLQAENLKLANRLVAISQASKADATHVFGLEASKIDVVYPCVSNEFLEPRLPSPRKRPYFLFCSVPDPHKNPRVVMEAFSKIESDCDLVFVSPQDTLYMPSLLQFAEELGISDRFTITGFVPGADLVALFQNAIALVSPSKMEGFGLPVAQAMRAGIPVITSRVSAQAEIANGVGILIDPNSAVEIAAAMNRILHETNREELARKGRERAQWFDSDKVTRELIDTYLSVLDK
jgi:glycosyltransferase involved in cell wall biosynthesis